MRRWCTSPQNNRNHRWGRHLVSSCQHLYEPSILWPACNCSCARHYLLRLLPVFSLCRQNGGCTRQRYCDLEWWPLSIGNDQGWGQTSCCRLYSILVSYCCEINWPDINMHFRIAWSLQLLSIEHHWNHRFFLYSNKIRTLSSLWNFPRCWRSVLFSIS